MSKVLSGILGLLAITSAVARATAAEAPTTNPHFDVLATFVGGVWSGVLPPQEGQPAVRIEMRFAWSENHQGIQFTSTWIVGDKRAPYTSGFYAWDGAKKQLRIFYTDSRGGLTEGSVEQDGNALVHELEAIEADGTVEHVRARLTKVDETLFTNEIFVMKDGAWTKFVEVPYKRGD